MCIAKSHNSQNCGLFYGIFYFLKHSIFYIEHWNSYSLSTKKLTILYLHIFENSKFLFHFKLMRWRATINWIVLCWFIFITAGNCCFYLLQHFFFISVIFPNEKPEKFAQRIPFFRTLMNEKRIKFPYSVYTRKT